MNRNSAVLWIVVCFLQVFQPAAHAQSPVKMVKLEGNLDMERVEQVRSA